MKQFFSTQLIYDHMIQSDSIVWIKIEYTPVKSFVMIRAKTDTICYQIKGHGMYNRDNMSGFNYPELQSTYGTFLSVGMHHIEAERSRP